MTQRFRAYAHQTALAETLIQALIHPVGIPLILPNLGSHEHKVEIYVVDLDRQAYG